jgi:hypothetical protein
MPSLFLVLREQCLGDRAFIIGYFGPVWSTLVADTAHRPVPRAAIGSVAGLVGFGGAIGIVFNKLGGFWLDAHPMASFSSGQQ